MNNMKKFYEQEADREVLWGTQREKALVENILPCIPGSASSILDAGCGNGFLLASIAQARSCCLYGVDISAKRLEDLRRRLPQARVTESSLDTLPFEDASFDVVIASQVLEHMPDVFSSVRELARVTRRSLILTVPYEQEPVRLRCPHCEREHFLDGHLHRFSDAMIASLSGHMQGMRLKRFRRFHTIYSYNRLSWKLPRFIRMGCDRTVAALSGAVPFFRPNYALAVFERVKA
jgi:ubiquinone/menaquinone biosynthesis C-methylase UbiE